jgi:ferredoxin
VNWEQQQQKMRDIASELLTNGKVDMIIGYEQASVNGKAAPAFITSPEEIQTLVWNDKCENMLAKYALRYKGKQIAIVAKACDARAIVGLMVEHQFPREQIVIIGMVCPGMTDERGRIYESCQVCRHHNPPVYDHFVGDAMEEGEYKLSPTMAKIDAMTPDERWAYFTSQMKKCIRCYSCRQACYLCYCNKCFVDRNQPRWVARTTDLSDNIYYHLGRIMHTAGRCVQCGACERVCPMDLKIWYLAQKVSDDCKELYDYDAGLMLDEKPALADYRLEDSQKAFVD